MAYDYANNKQVDQYGNQMRFGTIAAPGATRTTGTATADAGTWGGTTTRGRTQRSPSASAIGGAVGGQAGPTPATPYDPGAAASAAAASGAAARDAAGAAAPAADPYGSQSGNTYVEDRYLNRLYGQDPAFNYAMKRGTEEIGNRASAAGNFNSGAARQQESDFYANILAQSQGQLDALAGGASAARQGKLNAMFGQGMGLAGGQAGLSSAYDLGAAGNMQAANEAQRQMFLNKAGVDTQSAQGGFNNLLGLYTAYQSGGKAGG